jgi:hypothetical protein
VPYKIGNILTSDNSQFLRKPPAGSSRPANLMSHPFGRTCHKRGITHDLFPSGNPGNIGKLSHPRPKTQITGDRQFHYEDHAHLWEHFLSFFDTYYFTRRLKTLQGLTPHEFVCLCWKTEPGLFWLNSINHTSKLNMK